MSTIIIPARYESSRLPGKPLRKIGGVPMIVRVAERCLQTIADRVIVVTDDTRILDACNMVDGLEVTMSSPDIPTGTDRIAKVARYIEDDIVINVQGDEPFIPVKLINQLIEDLQANPETLMNTACVPFADESEAESPNAVKVVFDKNRYALYFSRWPIPFNRDKQAECVRHRHIGIYGFRRDFLLRFTEMEKGVLEGLESLEQLRALEHGVRIKVLETDYSPISVDTEEDLARACAHANEVKNHG